MARKPGSIWRTPYDIRFIPLCETRWVDIHSAPQRSTMCHSYYSWRRLSDFFSHNYYWDNRCYLQETCLESRGMARLYVNVFISNASWTQDLIINLNNRISRFEFPSHVKKIMDISVMTSLSIFTVDFFLFAGAMPENTTGCQECGKLELCRPWCRGHEWTLLLALCCCSFR